MSEPLPAYEVCIIGAGITGMNALVVASTHLPQHARVCLVDSRPRVGGMWVDTYDHVRLHQPHRIFTAGNITWALDREPSHLATKHEVLDHFQRCYAIARERLDVDERFGWEYESHVEVDDHVEVSLRTKDGRREVVHASRLIKALGHQVLPTRQLEVTSNQLRSITPETMAAHDQDLRADDSPVWIIGSGKTAMDAAHQLITTMPGRRVNMLAGPGTMFARRDTFFPTGARRWWAGTPINSMTRQLGRRFDGTNEDEVRAWFGATYGISPTEEARDFFSAYLSEKECATIRSGLSTVENEYFEDAVDSADHVELVLKSGRRLATDPGSWLVNCTGSLLRTPHPYEPFTSPSGRILSLQMRSSTTGVFSSFAGYFMTHLMFTGQLADAGVCELDIEELHAKAKPLVIYASMSVTLHNLSRFFDALPARALLDCGLDYDRWFPLPRRLAGTLQFMRTHRRDRVHHLETLAAIRDRYDVRCGPLQQAPRSSIERTHD